MAGAKLPPQAYTRETLALAYDWLQNQPGSVRELASNPDNLVALYLQSKRRIKDGLPTFNLDADENAKSKASFKNELKSLSEGLKQFEESSDERELPQTVEPPQQRVVNPSNTQVQMQQPAQAVQPQHQVHSQAQPIQQPQHQVHQPQGQQSAQHQHHIHAQPQVQVVVQQPGQQQGTVNGSPQSNPHSNYSQTSVFDLMDKRSQEMVTEVKEKFNLSSEVEAIRMLIAVGYERIVQVMPKR